MAKPKIFISYRRTDAIDTVRALYFQLRLRFGSSQVFMDVSAIGPGDVWPQRLKAALAQASTVLVVTGPTWLTAADTYGRRRLDLETDWVRVEIESAIQNGKVIIPLLVGGLRELPAAEGLPLSLRGLLEQQQFFLNDANWDRDLNSLVDVLVQDHGFRLVDPDMAYPLPAEAKASLPPLSEDELFEALKNLPGWEPIETAIPRDYPRSRHELRRGFRFQKFKHAIAFLQSLVDPINAMEHHPRIENQWRTVYIHFTTWDVGNRITAVDIAAARMVDERFKAFLDSVDGTVLKKPA